MGGVVSVILAVLTFQDPFLVSNLDWVDLGVQVNFANPLSWGIELMARWPAGEFISHYPTAVPRYVVLAPPFLQTSQHSVGDIFNITPATFASKNIS